MGISIPSSSRSSVLRPFHKALRGWILGVIANPENFGIDYDAPRGDVGLFGPASVTWKIHADFPGMMAGGIAALMLQTLHPRALAGVWDHSSFREDTLGRLRHTIRFVAATTYAPSADAHRMIAFVNRIHDRVHGTTADGQPYSARAPDLLTWVHCTEMVSFLAGYRRYRCAHLAAALEDRYFDETRRIAEALGARDVPASRAEMEAYFQNVQPQLRFDERARETLAVLDAMRLPIPAGGLSRRVFLGAGAALLPDWACSLMGRSRSRQALDRAAAATLHRAAPLIRASMSEGVAMRSARRCGATRACLHFE